MLIRVFWLCSGVLEIVYNFYDWFAPTLIIVMIVASIWFIGTAVQYMKMGEEVEETDIPTDIGQVVLQWLNKKETES